MICRCSCKTCVFIRDNKCGSYLMEHQLHNFLCTGRQHVIQTRMSWMVVFVSKFVSVPPRHDTMGIFVHRFTHFNLRVKCVWRVSFIYCLLPPYSPGKLHQHLSDWTASIAVVFTVQDRKLSLSGSKPASQSPNSWPNTYANWVICYSLFVRVHVISAV